MTARDYSFNSGLWSMNAFGSSLCVFRFRRQCDDPRIIWTLMTKKCCVVFKYMLTLCHIIRCYVPWLPDGYSQILRLYAFGPLGCKDYGSATLRWKIWSLPFLGLCPHALHPGAIQGKEGIKFCHLATSAAAPDSLFEMRGKERLRVGEGEDEEDVPYNEKHLEGNVDCWLLQRRRKNEYTKLLL